MTIALLYNLLVSGTNFSNICPSLKWTCQSSGFIKSILLYLSKSSLIWIQSTSIFFLIYLIKNKKLYFLNCLELKLFLVFYIILIIGSLLSEYNRSILTTLPYIRFGLFLLLIKYLIINNKEFINNIKNACAFSPRKRDSKSNIIIK